MRMQKIQFRIGELAKQLNVEKFVIRFWEKEFGLPTYRSSGGQRFYSQEHLEQFKIIKTLLYDQGFTIAGAKKQLDEHSSTVESIVGSCKTTIQADEPLPATFNKKLILLREQLIALHKLL